MLRGLPGSRQFPSPRLVRARPEPGPLPSTGVTQLPRYYGPLRRLPRPSPEGTGAGSPRPLDRPPVLLLAHLPALVALTAPSVNSYRRLQPRFWSSAYLQVLTSYDLRGRRARPSRGPFRRGPTGAPPPQPSARSLTAPPRRHRMARGQRAIATPTLAFAPTRRAAPGAGSGFAGGLGEVGLGRPPAALPEVAGGGVNPSYAPCAR